MAINICINGAKGRMGQAVANAAKEAGHTVTGEVDLGDDLEAALQTSDVVIDFSFHTVTRSVFETATKLGKAIVCGTTGHNEKEKHALETIATQTTTIWAGNFSIGVNLLCYLTERATEILPESFNAEIIEMHHRLKKDAPSGTALMLADSVMDKRDLNSEDLRHGRQGITGERASREVGMHALRGGDVIGDHTVVFADIGERIELSHKASHRSLFARGAVKAAEWSIGKQNGLYSMRDVLGLH